MRSKVILGVAALAVSCACLAGLRALPRAAAEDPCVVRAGASVPVAVVGSRLRGAQSPDPAPTGGTAALKHVAAQGSSLVYVRDRHGYDDVVIDEPEVQTVLREPGEVDHPAWGPGGSLVWGLDDRLVIRSEDGTQRMIAGPRHHGSVLSPVFRSGGVVAVVAAEPTAAVPEDEWSNDLWRYRRGAWTRLTRFRAGADRWTAIRTPIARPDGSLAFVVVQGRGSTTELPRFSLWRLVGDRPERVRDVAGEAYLAGTAPDGRPLWNVPDRAAARWLIVDDDGVVVGCGAVAVDPLDRVDPDRTGHAAPPRATAHQPLQLGDPAEVALVVGDFGSRGAAAVVAAQVTQAYAGRLPVDLVVGERGSSMVRRGAWAVIVRLGASTDGVRELAELRAMLPALADHAWITVP